MADNVLSCSGMITNALVFPAWLWSRSGWKGSASFSAHISQICQYVVTIFSNHPAAGAQNLPKLLNLSDISSIYRSIWIYVPYGFRL